MGHAEMSQEGTVCPDQCRGRGWFLHRNITTKRMEIRACDLCEIYESDEEAGEAASMHISTSLELADNVTKVRKTDRNIRTATAKAFGEPVAVRPRRDR